MVTAYSCTQCLKKLSCRDSYVKHLRYHNSKQHSKFKCEKCEYAARDSCNLRRHHKQKHSIDDVPRMSVGGMDVDAVGSGRMDNVSDEGHMVDLPKVSAQEVNATRAAVQASYVTKEKHVREKLLDIFQDINVGVEGKNEKDVLEVQDNTLLVRRSVPISPNKDSKVPLSECGMEDVSVVSVGMGNVSDKVYKVGFPKGVGCRGDAIEAADQATENTLHVRDKLQDNSQDIKVAVEDRDEEEVVVLHTLTIESSVQITSNTNYENENSTVDEYTTNQNSQNIEM